MQIVAAVARERAGKFSIEKLDLADPRADELLVRVVASGMCQTDLHGRDGYYNTPLPAVFGHEGAGVVAAIGKGVTNFAVGDHVVLSFPWCGGCANCKRQMEFHCQNNFELKMRGTRADGSTLMSQGGAPVYSAFFQQSSFATYAIANERFAVKVRKDAPLELLGPFACSGQTGAGAVLNAMQPRAGDAFAVFGVGAVGLSGLMAAKIAGCDPIIAVDIHEKRLALARELGATHVINHSGRNDVVADNQKDHRRRRALFAGDIRAAGGLARSHRGIDAGRYLRSSWQRAQRNGSVRRDAVSTIRPRGARYHSRREPPPGIHPEAGRLLDARQNAC